MQKYYLVQIKYYLGNIEKVSLTHELQSEKFLKK